MASSELDFVKLELTLNAEITIDVERVFEDPIWNTIYSTYIQPDNSNINDVFALYMKHYIDRDRFLRDAPMTCGPGHMTLMGVNKI